MLTTENRLENGIRPIQLEHQVKNFFDSNDNGLIPIDGDKIMHDSEYFNIVSQRMNYYRYFINLNEDCLKELELVQDMIEQELTE